MVKCELTRGDGGVEKEKDVSLPTPSKRRCVKDERIFLSFAGVLCQACED